MSHAIPDRTCLRSSAVFALSKTFWPFSEHAEAALALAMVYVWNRTDFSSSLISEHYNCTLSLRLEYLVKIILWFWPVSNGNYYYTGPISSFNLKSETWKKNCMSYLKPFQFALSTQFHAGYLSLIGWFWSLYFCGCSAQQFLGC